jgi:hypothetical protein
MTIITDFDDVHEVFFDGFELKSEIKEKIKERAKESSCHDLLCDQLREVLIDKKIFDEKGNFDAELMSQELPPLDEEALARLKILLGSDYDLVSHDRSWFVKLKLSFIPDIVNRYLNKQCTAEVEAVGGIVSYILGICYYVKALEKLGVEDAGKYIGDDVKKVFENLPPDIDLRTVCEQLSSLDLEEIESRIIKYLSRCIFRKVTRSTYSEVKNKAFLKKRHFVDLNNDFLIVTFGDRSARSVDNLIISKLERDQLFSKDALKIPLPTNCSVKELDEKTVKPTSTWLNGWPAIISKLTKTIAVKDPESVNHFGWIMLLSYLSREYCCLNDGAEEILRGTLVNHLLKNSDRTTEYTNLVNKTVLDHHYGDFVSACFIHLNASVSLGHLLTDADWKKAVGISDSYCSCEHMASRVMNLYLTLDSVPIEQMKAIIKAELENVQSIANTPVLVNGLADILYLPWTQDEVNKQIQERVTNMMKLMKSHEKKHSQFVEVFLDLMKKRDVPFDVIKSCLVIAGSQNFLRPFDGSREVEYVLRKHCGEEQLQVRIRNQDKIHTLLLPYDHQKSLLTLSTYLKKGLSKTSSSLLCRFWNIIHSGAVFEETEHSRVQYLEKGNVGVSIDSELDFENEPLVLVITIQQKLLEFVQNGDLGILCDLYTLLPACYSMKEGRGFVQQLHLQILSVLKAKYSHVEFSLFEKSVSIKKSNQMQVIWLQTLIDIQDETLLRLAVNLIKKDSKKLTVSEHLTLLKYAIKTPLAKNNPCVLEWLDMLLVNKSIASENSLDILMRMISRMGNEKNFHVIDNLIDIVSRLCSQKWKRQKGRTVFLNTHPVFDVTICLVNWLLEHKHVERASQLLLSLPKERHHPSDTDFRHLWMRAFSALEIDSEELIEKAVQHWKEGVNRFIIKMASLEKDEFGVLISFAWELLPSKKAEHWAICSDIIKDIYKRKIPKEYVEPFSQLYVKYHERLVDKQEEKEIASAIRTLEQGTLTGSSLDAIEDKQFEYLLGKKQFDKALRLLQKNCSSSNSSKHEEMVNEFVQELVSGEKLSHKEYSQRIVVVKSLFSSGYRDFHSLISSNTNLDKLFGFFKEYFENSRQKNTKANTRFVLRVLDVVYGDKPVSENEKFEDQFSELLSQLLSNQSFISHPPMSYSKDSLKRLINNLMKRKCSSKVLELMKGMDIHKLIPVNDEQYMNWIIELTDQQLEEYDVDSDRKAICIQLIRSYLTKYFPSNDQHVKPLSRVAMYMMDICIEENNMRQVHIWASKIEKLIASYQELEFENFDKTVGSWVNRLRELGHIDDAAKLMKLFEGEDLSANLPMVISLIKDRMEKKQYTKAIDLLKPYKRKDLEGCEEVNILAWKLLSHLLAKKLNSQSIRTIHRVLMTTNCLDLSLWNLYLKQCLKSNSNENKEKAAKGFINLFRKSPVRKSSLEYKQCYAQAIELTCMGQPEKSLEWIPSIQVIWKVLGGQEAADLRKHVTKVIIMTAKRQLVANKKYPLQVLKDISVLFQMKEYIELFEDDLVEKSYLELVMICVFLKVDDLAISVTVNEWFMSFVAEYREIIMTDDHAALFNELIHYIDTQSSVYITCHLNFYQTFLWIIKSSKNTKLDGLKFIAHTMTHQNPMIIRYMVSQIDGLMPYIMECMRKDAEEIINREIKTLPNRKRSKGKVVNSSLSKKYNDLFGLFSSFFIGSESHDLASELLDDEKITSVVLLRQVKGMRKRLIIGVLAGAVESQDRKQMDDAIEYYCIHCIDFSKDMDFQKLSLDKVFDICILYLTKHEKQVDFINAIRKVLAAVYREEEFKKLPIYALMRAAFGPKIEAPKGVSLSSSERPTVGKVMMLNEKQIFYQSAIMMVQKCLEQKSENNHTKYLLLTVSYMIISQLISNKRQADESLLHCLHSFYLSPLPLNDIALYTNHLTRCLGMLYTMQQTGILQYYPDLYTKFSMVFSTPKQLKKLVTKNTINSFRKILLEHVQLLVSQNTFTSFKNACTLIYQSFPSLYQDSPEAQRKIFNQLFAGLKVNPLEKYPKSTAFDQIYADIGLMSCVGDQEFVRHDMFGGFGLYQDVLTLKSGEPFDIPKSSKVDFAFEMLQVKKYRFSSKHELIDIKKDQSIYLMFAKTVSDIIIQELSVENYSDYIPLYDEVSCFLLVLLEKQLIQANMLGHCLSAVHSLSMASIDLFKIQQNEEILDRSYRLIKGYAASTFAPLGANLLLKWVELLAKSENQVLIQYGRKMVLTAICEMDLKDKSLPFVEKMKQALKMVG